MCSGVAFRVCAEQVICLSLLSFSHSQLVSLLCVYIEELEQEEEEQSCKTHAHTNTRARAHTHTLTACRDKHPDFLGGKAKIIEA